MTRRTLAWASVLVVLALTFAAFMRHPSEAPEASAPPATASAPHLGNAPADHGAGPAAPRRALPVARPRLSSTAVAGDARVDAAASRTLSLNAPLAVTGEPSVSPSLVNAVLDRERSPLAGYGAVICAEGRRADIDPAFLLATVSYFDLRDPLPARSHNVGHVRSVAGQPSVNGYRAFATWQAGIRSWYALIRGLYVRRWGLTTVDGIEPLYAPGTAQAVEAEVSAMRAMIQSWRAYAR